MEKRDIISFFDKYAPVWDDDGEANGAVIEKILDNAFVHKGNRVLDVACGTGVLFPYYLRRGVDCVLGVDISSRMISVAKQKYKDTSNLRLLCADIEEAKLTERFDRIVVYNALPHFEKPERLIKALVGLLDDNGRLTFAHGASREEINNCHKGSASAVSTELMSAETLKALLGKYLDVDVCLDNSEMYQVSGVKKGDSV